MKNTDPDCFLFFQIFPASHFLAFFHYLFSRRGKSHPSWRDLKNKKKDASNLKLPVNLHGKGQKKGDLYLFYCILLFFEALVRKRFFLTKKKKKNARNIMSEKIKINKRSFKE